MHKRTLNDLNLLDDFLLNSIVSYPGIGEEFCKILLGILFQRNFQKLKVEAQKTYYGTDTEKHGARLDVYLEDEDIDGLSVPTVFDVEAEQKDAIQEVLSLPRRTRFYHAKIDARSLKSGEKYGKLKNVIVIMIMPFDPFDRGRMTYTVRNMCVEVPDMPYDDGATTLFFYTRGKDSDTSQELKQLLTYMEQTNNENACNDTLRTIQNMVDIVKQDQEVSISYMKIMEREEMLIKQGIEQGIEQGIAQGMQQERLELVRSKLIKGQTIEKIASDLLDTPEHIQELIEILHKPNTADAMPKL